jgi:hypothetical protein
MRHVALQQKVRWYETWEKTPEAHVEVLAVIHAKGESHEKIRPVKYDPNKRIWSHPPDLSEQTYTTDEIKRWAYLPIDPWPVVREMMEPKWRKNGRLQAKNRRDTS